MPSPTWAAPSSPPLRPQLLCPGVSFRSMLEGSHRSVGERLKVKCESRMDCPLLIYSCTYMRKSLFFHMQENKFKQQIALKTNQILNHIVNVFIKRVF